MFVYEGVEGHAVFPAGGEVGDVDGGIPARQEPEATVSAVANGATPEMVIKQQFRIK